MTFINAVVKSPQRRTKEKRRFSLGRFPPEACRTKRETDFAYFRAHWKRAIRGSGKRLTPVTLSSSRHSCFQEPISTPLCLLGRQGRCLMNPTGMCKLSAMPRLQGGCSRKASPKVDGFSRPGRFPWKAGNRAWRSGRRCARLPRHSGGPGLARSSAPRRRGHRSGTGNDC